MEVLKYFIIMVAIVILLFVLATKFKLWRKVYILVATVVMIVYIVWRLIYTINVDTLFSSIFSIMLFVAELLGVIVALFSMNLFFKKDKPQRIAPKLEDDYRPSIDIFVCTYNEPFKLVVASALAAASLPYENKRVFICDDGKRPLLKMAAEALDISYITRTDNKHAKAGNINNALSVTNSEFVMLLDADFIVKPFMIMEAIPHFQDEKVALIQYPQSFYNKDSFQMLNDKFFNEQDFFMRYIEPQLAERNATVHIGTNALIRRSALEEVGGIPTASITEDMATGMLLQNAGYKTIFINKAYALGLAPFELKDLKSQRQRWAKGTLQIFKSLRPLFLKGLSIKQKTIYLELLLYWFTSFQKLIYIFIPTVFMIFGIPIVNITPPEFLLIFVPTLLMFFMSFRVLIGSVRTYTSSHIYDTLMAPFHASAILQELFVPNKKFNVTPKEVSEDKKADFRPVIPHIVLAIWLFIAIGFTVDKLINGIAILPLIVCAGWTIYNLYGLLYSIATAKKNHVETAGEALSVDIDEKIICNNLELNAYKMSFDGFRAKKQKGVDYNFIKDAQYEIEVPRTGLKSTVVLVNQTEQSTHFIFDNTSKEAAYRLSKYYVEKIHAAHMLDFDREGEA